MPTNIKLKMKLQLLASDNNDNKTVEEQLAELQQQFIDMKNKHDELESNYNIIKEENKTLSTTNTKLFYQVTGGKSDDNIDDQVNEYEEYVGKEFYDTLTKKEKQLLHTILEGEDE